jgi:hypothetical protein
MKHAKQDGLFRTVDGFSSQAAELRQDFDRRFADPHNTDAARFVWDFWHVPNEYTVLRTPAYHYFSQDLYKKFHIGLVEWGRKHLGCHDVSPPWLSCYIEGCRQEKHVDVPHGPLAFVFSLTDWSKRKFKGGETFLRAGRKPEILIPPVFNRLTLFNPSIPHGVREVRGTLDPRFGRLVIHGWFVNPRPFWTGPLTAADIERGLSGGLTKVFSSTTLELGPGLLSLRLKIAQSGEVNEGSVLVNTLHHSSAKELKELFKRLKSSLKFKKSRRPTSLTLPLIFE